VIYIIRIIIIIIIKVYDRRDQEGGFMVDGTGGGIAYTTKDI